MKRLDDHHRPGVHSRLPRPLIASVFVACLVALGWTQAASVSTSGPANQETTQLFFDHLNGNQGGPLLELFTDDAAIHTPEGEFHGPGGAELFAATLNDAFPTIAFTIRQFEIVDDIVIVQWSMTGRQYGDYQGQPASCSSVTTIGTTLGRFEDRLIDELWIHYDRLTLLRQIESFTQIDSGSRPTCRNH